MIGDRGNYDDNWIEGWEEGRQMGFEEGCIETAQIYEPRLAAFWVELQTLNARIAYLERVITEKGL